MHDINVAIVGCGYVANGHLKAWSKVREAQVVAVSDLNESLAKSTADLWKVPRYYKSLSELIEWGKIDLVDICTPPQTHAALAIQAMKAGFNVLIEKPMTMTVKDAEQIVECRKSTGIKAGVIHNWLFDVPVLEADYLVKKGYLGDIFNVEIEALNTKYDSMVTNERHWSHRLQGGRFSEMLAHPIYLLRHFLGEVEICDLQVSKIGDYPWMRFDELCASFRVGNKLGRAYASFNSSRDAIFISLYGSEAILKLELINATVNVLPKRKTSRFSKGFDSLRQATQLTKSTIRNAAKITFKRWMSGHDMYIKLFAESLLNGTYPPVTVEDGLEVIKTLEKMCGMIESAELKAET
jgi:predicted dehydrogenase